jgi:uncharacterized membrane protein YbhN (UPF0104 family)
VIYRWTTNRSRITGETRLRKFLLIVLVLDSVGLVVLFAVILIQGSSPTLRDWAVDLGAVWGGVVGLYAGMLLDAKWKARKRNQLP